MKSVKVSGVLLYLFGFTLVLLLYVNYIFLPLNQKVSALSSEHNADTRQTQSYELQTAQIDDLQQKINKLKTELKTEQNGTALTGKNVAEDIGKIVGSSGVTMQSVSMGKEQAEKGKTASNGKLLQTVSVELNVICTPAQLPKLTGYFENQSEGVYCITHVSTAPESNGSGGISAILTMTLYYLSEGAEQ
nr:hypothetical protein [uncultured Caproiciproducens sp.]